jgi:hypothetical protein
MQRPTTRSTYNVNVTGPRQFVADQAANAHKRPSLADIRRHRDWRYRALLEADPKRLFENPSIPASALEILAAAKNAGVMPYSKIINDRGSPHKERV